MNNQAYWHMQPDENGKWIVAGPYRVVRLLPKGMAELNDGSVAVIAALYHTKGGATKACYRKNYDSKA